MNRKAKFPCPTAPQYNKRHPQTISRTRFAVTEIEDELTALGERWSHTCQWTLEQLRRLQALHSHCAALDEQHARLLRGAVRAEGELKQMEANPVSAVGDAAERIAALQRCALDLARAQREVADHAAAAARLLHQC
ncbi:hypothetical protein evm_015370, partial [Chilo suppressalis]